MKFYDIPINIPSDMHKLNSIASPKTVSTGPEVITWIGNTVIHGEPTNRNQLLNLPTDIKVETWKLGKWYLELLLLSLFNYQGYYFNWVEKDYSSNDKGESVPWATQIKP